MKVERLSVVEVSVRFGICCFSLSCRVLVLGGQVSTWNISWKSGALPVAREVICRLLGSPVSQQVKVRD